jgi:hypothetical protein
MPLVRGGYGLPPAPPSAQVIARTGQTGMKYAFMPMK